MINLNPLGKIIRFGALVVFCAGLHTPLYALENQPGPWTYILDTESLFGASESTGDAQGMFNTAQKWLTSLAYKITPGDQLIGLYNGSFDKSDLFVAQEEGARKSNKLLTQNVSVAYKKDFGQTFSCKPVFFYDVINVQETKDEKLGKGLYDYRDIGGGFENTHILGGGAKPVILTYGFNVFGRHYPNFVSLYSLYDPNSGVETREKDFVGYKFDTGLRSEINPRLLGTVDAMFMYKDFTDKKTVDENGIRTADGRQDFYYEILGTLRYTLTEDWALDFDSGFRQNVSNLDFYDTRNTSTLLDDRFYKGYYSYLRFNVGPALMYSRKAWNNTTKPLTLRVGYNFDGTAYPDRKALDAQENLKEATEWDALHTTYARITVPLTKQLDWIVTAKYDRQVSNQKFEVYYRYNYEVWSVLSGIAFQF